MWDVRIRDSIREVSVSKEMIYEKVTKKAIILCAYKKIIKHK